MAEHFGTFVGTPQQATPVHLVDKAYERSTDGMIVRDLFTNAAATAQNDTIRAAIVGWETILDPWLCRAWWTAGGAGCTLSLGDVTHPTALDNAVDISAAGVANLCSAVTKPNLWLPVWQQLGYADLPTARAVGAKCELLFTIGGAVFAAGTIAWRLGGDRRV